MNETQFNPTDSRPRILLVSTSSGSRGGGEIYLLRLANQLAERGVDVQCLLSDHERMDELAQQFSPDVPVFRRAFQNTYDRRLRSVREVVGTVSVAMLQDILTDLQPDLVHLNKQNLEDGLDWMRAIERLKLPSVTTIHVTRSMRTLGAMLGRLRDRFIAPILRRARTHFITVSKASRRDLLTILGDDAAARVSAIPNGVPDAPQGDREWYRREWKVPEDAVVLGTVARVEAQKNPLFVVRLLAALPERVHFVWIGDGRLRTELERTARAAGVEHRLHLDGWQSDARQRLAGLDAFVLPSLFEGFPLAIVEALAAGVPCLVSDVDGNGEAVADSESGFVLPLSDLYAWTAAVGRLMESPSLRTTMGHAARERFEQHFGLETMVAATQEVYENALATGRCEVSA